MRASCNVFSQHFGHKYGVVAGDASAAATELGAECREAGPERRPEFFRATTARFLDELVPPAELRRLRDDPSGFDLDYWRRGAELGWTSLLVAEQDGGGSISGEGLVDLTLVAHEFGMHASPGPLVPANLVAAALSDTGTHGDVLAAVLAGSSIVTWCGGAPRFDSTGGVAIDVRDGDVVLDGLARPVESAAVADQILATGRTGTGSPRCSSQPTRRGSRSSPCTRSI